MGNLSSVFNASGSDTVQRANTLMNLTVNNTTGSTRLFNVVGSVEVLRFYGIVTTVLSSAVTAAYVRINDQAAQPVISLVTGVALSSATVGSLISRHSTVGVALIFTSAAAGAVKDPVAATAPAMMMPFSVTQKTGGIQTDIEFTYTTTNAPSTGTIQWFCEWRPLSADGVLTVI